MAQEDAWGYKRIRGQLKKLGTTLWKSCIAAILRHNGLPPAPERGGLTWREFLGGLLRSYHRAAAWKPAYEVSASTASPTHRFEVHNPSVFRSLEADMKLP